MKSTDTPVAAVVQPITLTDEQAMLDLRKEGDEAIKVLRKHEWDILANRLNSAIIEIEQRATHLARQSHPAIGCGGSGKSIGDMPCLGCDACPEFAPPLASAPQADELIELLKAIRPNYGAVGSRDVDVAAQQKRIDRAIELLSVCAPQAERALFKIIPTMTTTDEAEAEKGICPACHIAGLKLVNQAEGMRFFQCAKCNDITVLHAAPVAQEGESTDISQRLREYASNPGYSHGDYADTMRLAANECDRFYGGMMNWKANAQAKDRTIIELRSKLAAPSSTESSAQAAPYAYEHDKGQETELVYAAWFKRHKMEPGDIYRPLYLGAQAATDDVRNAADVLSACKGYVQYRLDEGTRTRDPIIIEAAEGVMERIEHSISALRTTPAQAVTEKE